MLAPLLAYPYTAEQVLNQVWELWSATLFVLTASYVHSTVYLKKDASEARVKELASQNDIVRFASHAELNEDDPLASAIRLAESDEEDGRLEVRESA